MGLIALFGLAVLIGVGSAALIATGVASFRSRSVPLFWIVAVVLAVALPFAFVGAAPLQTSSGSDYGALGHFLNTAFSWVNAVIVGGAVLSMLLSLGSNPLLRVASAATWGFLASFVVRIANLF
jgi:hypothetical protein